MPINLPLHHIGIATKSIKEELFYFQALGLAVEDEFIDETQGVRGVFLTPREKAIPQYRLELLENLGPDGPLVNYLKRRVKMYHIAYEVKNIEESLDALFENLEFYSQRRGGAGGKKAMIVKPVMKASYFSRICFVMLKNHLLVELVEK